MTDAPLKHFLIVFDASTGGDPFVQEFGQDRTEQALDAYRDAERKFRGRHELHIVLIGADSIETVRRTHSNYFSDASVRYLEAALAAPRVHTAL